MSDPVTNVEIEDVLSSIRRLVSDGDKARTRDPAPAEADSAPVQDAPETPAETSESKPDKFVLTPALLVVDNNAPSEDVADVENSDPDEEEWVEEIDEATSSDSEPENGDVEDPLPLTDLVWDSVNDARKAGVAAVPADEAVQTPDRSELVATIAELEAAVSNDVEDFEPDGSEEAGDLMGETIAWPGTVARKFDDVPDAEETTPAPEFNPDLEADDASVAFEHRKPDAEPEQTDEAETKAEPETISSADTQDEYGDDDLDGLLEAGGVTLDEEALRALVSEVVREELTGPLGERITRNVRKLVRREIYRILSSQEFD
ncbi:hypothetical protein [Octadecabacter ascidiaceicola]|uniref:Uncharacterized protein n=1 Tax=Octadecabacter ascidiaceicola TaxID=1655543 RepID=A0A238K367_9RHOB|nr:hypothetical protein [Octadecabacter ascidiaceicola]SMX37193.1 hypothetical protein OCA8868_01321 [Octadecabacter ascidiaceicola]